MGRHLTPIILIILAIGIFFTFTTRQYEQVKTLREVSGAYTRAVEDSLSLLRKRDQVVDAYNSISRENRDKLSKTLPDHIDNVRLILDTKSVFASRNIPLKSIKSSITTAVVRESQASSQNSMQSQTGMRDPVSGKMQEYVDGPELDSVTLSLSFSTSYENFLRVLQDLEANLRLMEIAKLTLAPSESGITYDITLDLKTYWLKK